MAAHDEALTYGGRAGILNIDAIQSAIGRPYSGYYRPIARKAAAFMESLTRNHGFVDGNKRTALLVVLLLLERSGYSLEISQDERIDDLVADAAQGLISHEDLVLWFKPRLKRQRL